MSLERLTTILPPPARPLNTGTPDEWAAAERALGFALPTDYKQFTDVYGTGVVADFIVVLNPFVPLSTDNLVRGADTWLEFLRLARKRNRKAVPYPLYPEPEGLFPWGTTDKEQTLLWHRVGQPDHWATVVCDRVQHWRYEQTMTDLLASWLSWERIYDPFPVWYLDPSQFPDDEGNAPPLRIPTQPRTPVEAHKLFKPFARMIGDIQANK